MAYLQVPAQLGPVLGPPIGGFITTYFSWRWIFLVNVPLGILGIVLVTVFFDNPKEETRRPLDWLGFLLTGAALFCIMYGIEGVGRGKDEFTTAIVLLVLGVTLGTLALRHLWRSPHPLLDLSVFRIDTFRASIGGGSLLSRRRGNAGVSAAAAAAGRVRHVGVRLGSDHVCDRRRLDVDEDDGAADPAALRLPQCHPRQRRHQRRDHRHVRAVHRRDAGAADLRAAAHRRFLPVAAVHRDAGHDLCRRASPADEHGDQHRQHGAAIEPRLRHFLRGGAAEFVARLARRERARPIRFRWSRSPAPRCSRCAAWPSAGA